MNAPRHICSVLFAILLLCGPLSASAWDVWICDGITDLATNDTPGCGTIREAYENSLPVLCPWETNPRNPDCLKLDNLEENIRDVGEWEGFRVAHVVDSGQFHQSILLEDPQTGWHFVYIQFGALFQCSLGISPQFWDVSGRSVLSNRLPIEDPGGYHLDLYWVKDGKTGDPVFLDLSAIQEAVTPLLPPNGTIGESGDNLDLRSLAYSTSVWLPLDSPAHPSGGTIAMSLAIEGTRVTVADARWNPLNEE